MKENINNPKKDTTNRDGFGVPDGYFDNLEDQVISKWYAHKKALPDKLEHGFTVPTGYFEKAPVGLQVNKPKGSKPVIKLFNKKVISLSIAASILIFISIKTLSNGSTPAHISDYSSEELLSWLETDATDVTSYDIAEVFDNLSLDEEYYSDEIILDYVADSDFEELLIEN